MPSGASIRINGSPIASNNLIVDGLSSINPYVPDVNINPVTDAVQEFKVQTSTMSSEFGFTLGGVVNLVTKSGSNQFHGTLYHYLRNDAVDSNSWTANRTARPKLPLRYNHFGGTLGGLSQAELGTSSYAYALGGLHLYWHHNLMLDAEGGYHFPFENIDHAKGPRAQLTARFSMW